MDYYYKVHLIKNIVMTLLKRKNLKIILVDILLYIWGYFIYRLDKYIDKLSTKLFKNITSKISVKISKF